MAKELAKYQPQVKVIAEGVVAKLNEISEYNRKVTTWKDKLDDLSSQYSSFLHPYAQIPAQVAHAMCISLILLFVAAFQPQSFIQYAVFPVIIVDNGTSM